MRTTAMQKAYEPKEEVKWKCMEWIFSYYHSQEFINLMNAQLLQLEI